MLEVHGVGKKGGQKVVIRETQDGRVHITTDTSSGEYLSKEEARYLASRLRRAAWRIEVGLPQMTEVGL
jgi:hypothetical protein